jgi:hypothetical protein
MKKIPKKKDDPSRVPRLHEKPAGPTKDTSIQFAPCEPHQTSDAKQPKMPLFCSSVWREGYI